MITICFLILLCCGHLLIVHSNDSAPVSFRTSISAPWFSEQSLEALELIASYNVTTYHQLLPIVSQLGQNSLDSIHLVSLAFQHGLPDHAGPLVQLSVSLRQFAPRIHALYSAALDHGLLEAPPICNTFVVRIDHDVISCDMDHVRLLLQDPKRGLLTPVIPDLDLYTFGPASCKQNVLLFANPFDKSFPEIWEALIKLSIRISLRYVPFDWRTSFTHNVPIYGYHTHLQIKNTEYKVTDDRQNALKIEPAPGPPLIQMNEKALVTFPAKMAHNVTSFERLVQLTQDYPRLLPEIEFYPTTEKEISALKDSEERLSQMVGDHPAHVFINGQSIPDKTESMYHLLKFINHEHRLFSKSAGDLKWDDIQTFLKSAPAQENGSDRFDYCSIKSIDNQEHSVVEAGSVPSLIWLNNLEADEQYEGWPKSLDTVVQIITRGLRPIARNMFNIILFLDLSDKDHCQVLEDVMLFISRGTPIRFGIVPWVTKDMSSIESSAAIHFLENSIEHGPQNAARSWSFPHNPQSTHDNKSGAMREKIHQNLYSMFMQFDITKKDEMMINGQFVEFSPRTYQSVLGQYLQAELETIGHALFNSVNPISEETDFGSYPCKGAWTSRPKYIFQNAEPHEFSESAFLASTSDPIREPLDEQNAMPFVHVSLHGAFNSAQTSVLQQAQERLGFALEPTPTMTLSESPFVVINGHRFSNFPNNPHIELVEIMVRREVTRRILPQLLAIKSVLKITPQVFWRMSSLWYWNKVNIEPLLPKKMLTRRIDISLLPACQPGTCLQSEPKKSRPLVHVTVILHPVSEEAQKLAPVLFLLNKDLPDTLITVLWRSFEVTTIPDRFTRFVGMNGHVAEFTSMPPVVYTLAMDTPASWAVIAKSSELDLDNLVITQNSALNTAEFELESLLVEGHAQEKQMGQSRGMQLTLSANKTLSSTIVMANLGYFQFKAKPGLHTLNLRKGQTTEIYMPYDQSVVIQSLCGVMLYPTFQKQEGKELEEVIRVSEPSHGLTTLSWFKRISSVIFGPQVEKVHVFSVASGHLYERFLAIMIQSVVAKASCPVKFWLLGEFLSPSFIRFLPYLANEVGFEYQLLSYNWPDWLRSQSNKQRKIWGYKILFLDVLFPLENGPDRIIFVDADQVVRADLVELMAQDLEGKVYGFTPFCDSRPEIDGYRFWRQGFWATHLRGKPYHISALYVVDLQLFRMRAAGDILRSQYQSLSADPNSLANLDQDLPNYLQSMLEIYSLPQDWLWCETWCSDASLSTAKTIDLCNNPMTREPKLDRARRLLPEWSVYDERTEMLLKKVVGNPTEPKEPTDPMVEKQEL